MEPYLYSPICLHGFDRGNFTFGLIHSRDGNYVVYKVESSWNVTAHGDAREGKWRRNWRMEWAASTLHTTSEHGVSSINTADAHTSAASSRLNWRPPTDLNGLVRFAERRNLVSARVPSYFKRSLRSKHADEMCVLKCCWWANNDKTGDDTKLRGYSE